MAHQAPQKSRDHLWVLAVIAICALLEVWASWLGIGSVSGFPKLGKMTTGWILPVTTEAYWGYAVWAWLASSPGPRSRRFAMWTAIVMFTLSLAGQESGHLVAAGHGAPPPFVVGFVTALPLIAVGLIAILIHLRQADREEAADAARREAEATAVAALERAENDERAALRAEVTAAREALAMDASEFRRELEAERDARADARREAEAAAAKVEVLTRKLAAASGQKATRKQAPKNAASTPEPRAASAPGTDPASPPEFQVPDDVDTQAAALEILANDPGISGSELGRRLGKTERYGCMLKKQLAGSVPGPEAGNGA